MDIADAGSSTVALDDTAAPQLSEDQGEIAEPANDIIADNGSVPADGDGNVSGEDGGSSDIEGQASTEDGTTGATTGNPTPSEDDVTDADMEDPEANEPAVEDPAMNEPGVEEPNAGEFAVEDPSSEDLTAVEEILVDAQESEIMLADDSAADASGFIWDGTTIIGYSGTAVDVDIPSNATAIGESAFADHDDIVSVTFTGGTALIGAKAFCSCDRLQRVELPSGLETIGECAFYKCTSLAEIHLPDGLKTIGDDAFRNCTSLTEIHMPDTVESIGSYQGCTGLTRVYISGGMAPTVVGTSYLTSIFTGCTSLEYLEFGEGITEIRQVDATNVTTIKLPSTVRTIDTEAFKDYTNLTTINFPEGLETVEYNAFKNCTALQEITLPASLRSIDDYAFAGCTSLQSVRLVDGEQKWISKGAFQGCTSLTTINMPASLYSIGEQAFGPGTDSDGNQIYLDKITELRFEGDGMVHIDKGAFDGSGNTRDIPVYCVAGSLAYKYFVNKKGFRVVTTDSINYSITYDLNGGTLPKGKTNPTAYTASKAVTLVAPTRAGMAFAGWLVDGTDVVITDNRIAANTYARDLTLIAQWREYSYQIIWSKNAKDAAGSMDPVTLAFSQEYTIPEEGYTRAGYDFLGWNTAAGGKGTSYVEGDVVQGLATKDGAKVTLYAQWQKSIYEIVYVLNDTEASPAVNHKSNPDSYGVSQKVSLKTPTRTGYIFDGWYTDAAFTDKITTITSALGDVTVYAKWTPITYTITFKKNKGTLPAGAAMSDITTTYDKAVTLPANAFARTGYAFLGWDLTAGSKSVEPAYKDGAEVINLSTRNKGKVTLYARWQVIEIPITYVLNDSEEDPAINSAKNPAYVTIEKNVVLSAPTRAGYKFGGWYTDAALTQALAKNTILKTTTDPVTVYASWVENSYTLKLDKNGGTYDIPAEVDGKLVVGKHDYEDEFLLPDGTGASRENYNFTGWNTKKDRSGKHYGLDPETGENRPVSGLATKGTVTLYAEWTPVESLTHDITYNNVTQEELAATGNPQDYAFDKDVRLGNPVRTGYTFKGWYYEDVDSNPNSKARKVTTISRKGTESIILYASWSENSYTIAYNANKGTLPKGSKMAAQTVLYSDEVSLTANVYTRKGYEFTGWNTKANGSGDSYADGQAVSSLIARNKGKITLYAQWEIVEYNITYVNADPEDGVENTNPAVYTVAKDVRLVNPSLYGYTFRGWYNDDPEENPKTKKVTKISKTTAADVTVYALWSENRYSLRFSGASVKSITNRLYTDELTIPSTVPTKDGYTFQGWALSRNGAVICQPGDTISFAELHAVGGTARGVIGTKYMTLYAVFE